MPAKLPPGITKRETKDSTGRVVKVMYRARYRDGLNAEPTKHFERLSDAKAWLEEGKSRVRSGTHVDHRASKITFKAYAEQWREAQPHTGMTPYRVQRTLEHHVYPTFGVKPIGAILPSQIQAWATKLPLSESSAGVILDLASAIFRSAIRDRLMAGANPCDDVRLTPSPKKRVWIPTDEQVDELQKAMAANYKAVVDVVIGSGMRQGELMGLEVDQIDFLRGKQVHIGQQLMADKPGEPPHLALPKGQKVRDIPLAQETLEALAAHMALVPPVEVEIEDRTNSNRPVTRTARLVFAAESGGPLGRRSWSRRWAPAARTAKWPSKTGLHALRHFYASMLIRGGAPANVVSERLGHGSTQFTWNTYIHLWPDADDQTREIMQKALRARSHGRRGGRASG